MQSIKLYNVASEYVCVVPGMQTPLSMTFHEERTQLIEQLGQYVQGWLIKLTRYEQHSLISDNVFPSGWTQTQWRQFFLQAGLCAITRKTDCYEIDYWSRTAKQGFRHQQRHRWKLGLQVSNSELGQSVHKALQFSVALSRIHQCEEDGDWNCLHSILANCEYMDSTDITPVVTFEEEEATASLSSVADGMVRSKDIAGLLARYEEATEVEIYILRDALVKIGRESLALLRTALQDERLDDRHPYLEHVISQIEGKYPEGELSS